VHSSCSLSMHGIDVTGIHLHVLGDRRLVVSGCTHNSAPVLADHGRPRLFGRPSGAWARYGNVYVASTVSVASATARAGDDIAFIANVTAFSPDSSRPSRCSGSSSSVLRDRRFCCPPTRRMRAADHAGRESANVLGTRGDAPPPRWLLRPLRPCGSEERTLGQSTDAAWRQTAAGCKRTGRRPNNPRHGERRSL